MIKAIIFDLDGTIADTIPAIQHALNITLERFGFTETNYERVRASLGSGTRALIEGVLPRDKAKNEKLVTEVVIDYEKSYMQTYLDTDKTYDGFYEAVETLKARGYLLAVLTNKSDCYVKPMIDKLLPKDSISVCIGRKDGIPRKPDPSVPLMIADYLGVSPAECAFVGDSDVDYLTGKNSGMTSVSVLWGYRSKEELLNVGATLFVDHPSELLDIFE